MLRIILNRLNPISENILDEEKAGFRKKICTLEQILNYRNMAEKHIEYGRKLYHNFVDFKKTFDRTKDYGK